MMMKSIGGQSVPFGSTEQLILELRFQCQRKSEKKRKRNNKFLLNGFASNYPLKTRAYIFQQLYFGTQALQHLVILTFKVIGIACTQLWLLVC